MGGPSIGRWVAGGLALGLVVAASSCSSCRAKPLGLAYDLTERVAVGERWASRETVLFGTATAAPMLTEGFYREVVADGEPYAWAGASAEVALQWQALEPRAAVVDLRGFEGVSGSNSAQVTLNGVRVGELRLSGERGRQSLVLPVAAQKLGDNRLRFRFDHTASPVDRSPESGDRRQLAAAFYSLVIGRLEDPGLQDLLGRDAPRPFRVERTSGLPGVTLVGPARVRFTVRLPETAELRFRPELEMAARAASASAEFSVTLEERGGAPRTLWKAVLGTRDGAGREVRVRLPGKVGEIARVGLEIRGTGSERFVWGRFGAPRILGRKLAPPLLARPPQRGGAEIARLRQAMRGLNVVLVVLDAGRAQQFGCYGYRRDTTPSIDRLASEGVVFENVFTPAVYTLGAMSSVWTSEYPDRHHSALSFAAPLPKDRLTLAEVLSARGVHTAGFVANAVAGGLNGLDRGFEEFHEVYVGHGSEASVFRKFVPGWLAANKERPFFLYLHFREPHSPYDPPAPFDTRFGPAGPIEKARRRDSRWIVDVNQGRLPLSAEEREHLGRLYDGNLAFVDQEVGGLRGALEQEGLLDRSVVIVMADHGEALFEHGWIGHNVELFETSVHVPFIVRFPKSLGLGGRRLTALADLLDVAPTVTDVFGLLGQGGSEKAFEGRSLLEVIAGGEGKGAVLSRTVWDRARYALRDEQYKYSYDSRTGEERLVDVRADPAEAKDIAGSEVLLAAYYREALQSWLLSSAEARGGTEAAPAMTRAQCENLKALGYLSARFDCPE